MAKSKQSTRRKTNSKASKQKAEGKRTKKTAKKTSSSASDLAKSAPIEIQAVRTDGSGSELLEQFGDALLDVGSKAVQLGRWSVSKVEQMGGRGVARAEQVGKLALAKAELEKNRFSLARAYEELGQSAAAYWQNSPRSALKANEKSIAESKQRVEEIISAVNEIEKRMDKIRGEG